MKIGQKIYGILLGCFLACLIVGCGQTPQKKPETVPPAPQKQISQTPEPTITVYMHETGEKKTMNMEDYIAGVVAGEMKNDWPTEALAAQAILARTFTIHQIETKGGLPSRGTQASTDIKEFQAYDAKAVNDQVRQAIQMTRGQILTYQGKPIFAWFHASAGGITATAKEGLNFKEAEPPYIASVMSPDQDAPPDVQNWTATIPKQDMMAALKKIGKEVTVIDTVEIGEKGPSGRDVTLRINGNLDVNGPDLRVALGGTKVKSMLLDKVEIQGDQIVFAGKGYGHGVGMSQWGAHNMARSGKKASEILNYYFKDVTLEKRYE